MVKIIMSVFILLETTVSPKKARKRKKKKGRKGREVNYLENTGMADASEIEISTIANAFSKETNLAIEENHQIATSAECFLSSPPRRRERASSRASTMHSEDFWERHFEGCNSISWKSFRAAFLEDYGHLIQEFAPQRIHWILTIVHKDIFAAADDIHKLYYDKFCGKSHHPDRLWLKIKEYASERIFREGVIESMFE